MIGENVFFYKGIIPASKSLMNRALICSSYSNDLKLVGRSSCDDVLKMKTSVEMLLSDCTKNNTFDCGAAGTVLRFLSVRLSRIPGTHVLQGSKRLMQRSHQDLLKVFEQLDVHCELHDDHMLIESKGWKIPAHPITVSRGISSQFTSGLLLNAWDLEHDLKIKTSGVSLSEGYLDMTLQVLRDLGMQILTDKDPSDGSARYSVAAKSHIKKTIYRVESDLSSIFAVAAFAALNGEAHFEEFPVPSLQPDFEFIKIMQNMGIDVILQESTDLHKKNALCIRQSKSFNGATANLQSCPDLFPVLAILCAFAKTPSHLYGAPHLIHKESNRVAKVSELLTHLNVEHETLADGMIIYPSQDFANVTPFKFDTDDDHRIAFASALILSQGLPIKIVNQDVVTKSFPEFWKVVGLVNQV